MVCSLMDRRTHLTYPQAAQPGATFKTRPSSCITAASLSRRGGFSYFYYNVPSFVRFAFTLALCASNPTIEPYSLFRLSAFELTVVTSLHTVSFSHLRQSFRLKLPLLSPVSSTRHCLTRAYSIAAYVSTELDCSISHIG